jgi:hypothetical protein
MAKGCQVLGCFGRQRFDGFRNGNLTLQGQP